MQRVKEYLNQAYRLNKLINNKQKQIDSLRSLSISLSCNQDERVQTSLRNDKISSMIAKVIDLEREITNDIDKYIDLKKEIMMEIDKLKNGDQIELLYSRYLEFKQWEYIAVEMGYSVRQIYRIHGEALKNLEGVIECH